jgi:hypothetical protein
MQLTLVPHPATPPSDPMFKVWANVDHAAALGAVASTSIFFGVGAPPSRFVIPAEEEPGRQDNLWQTTCFEAFLRASDGTSYREWNFAPSESWAAYDFTSEREGRTNADVSSPYIRVEDNLIWWALGATIAVEAEVNWQLALSAVLEEKNGTKSYWALAHGGDKPDFHDPGCFVARVP